MGSALHPRCPVDGSPPTGDWRGWLQEALAAVPPERRRRLRPLAPAGTAQLTAADGPPLLDLASNDYLGLSRHPSVLAAASAELAASGLGAGASRLVSGSRPVHQQLEQALAAWLGRETVLLFPSGFQANLAAVGALADRHSLVLADRLIHHSLLVGVRASGARLQRFRHNDPHDLARRLAAARAIRPGQRLLVLCESLYSMEGTTAPVAALAALCQQHGAALLVDEAHALGLLGPDGRGLAHGHPEVALVSGTFGKAFGSGGAFLAADGLLGDWILQASGAFRYTTALAPPPGRRGPGGPGPARRARRGRVAAAAAGPRPALAWGTGGRWLAAATGRRADPAVAAGGRRPRPGPAAAAGARGSAHGGDPSADGSRRQLPAAAGAAPRPAHRHPAAPEGRPGR